MFIINSIFYRKLTYIGGAVYLYIQIELHNFTCVQYFFIKIFDNNIINKYPEYLLY